MIRYIIKRVLLLIPIILFVSFIVFWLMTMTGDAAWTLAGENMTPAEVEALREKLGLNDPLIERYIRYLSGLVRGDMGKSLYGKDVWTEFSARMPYTIQLAISAMLLTTIIALPLGILAALKQNTWIDAGLSAFAMAGLSIPNFWLGLMMMLLFSVALGWLPSSGASEGIKSLIMPTISAGIGNAALVTRMTRSSMLDTIRADYLRTARAKGESERRVILKHALGNALIPIITILGSQFSILFGGALVTEMVFAWPGVGVLIVNSIRGNDFQMVTGCVVMTTIFVAVILLLVDLLYAVVDPRIRAQYSRK